VPRWLAKRNSPDFRAGRRLIGGRFALPVQKAMPIKACFDRRKCATNSIPLLRLHSTHRDSAGE
jgi:hypothetical protein